MKKEFCKYVKNCPTLKTLEGLSTLDDKYYQFGYDTLDFLKAKFCGSEDRKSKSKIEKLRFESCLTYRFLEDKVKT